MGEKLSDGHIAGGIDVKTLLGRFVAQNARQIARDTLYGCASGRKGLLS
jgi:hypothetical protein